MITYLVLITTPLACFRVEREVEKCYLTGEVLKYCILKKELR